MTRGLRIVIGISAAVAALLHVVSDLMEWANGGYSRVQLLINYAAFLPMPFIFMGIYAVQRPQIHWLGLAGALSYGSAFIYFAHTTLYALQQNVPDYATLWSVLGDVYTFHGVLMVVGGLLFAGASFSAARLNRLGVALFAAGLGLNLLFGLIAVPEIWQILGSSVRNLGIIIIGAGLTRANVTGR